MPLGQWTTIGLRDRRKSRRGTISRRTRRPRSGGRRTDRCSLWEFHHIIDIAPTILEVTGTTPFRSEKNTNWEGAFRVPCLIRWPGHRNVASRDRAVRDRPRLNLAGKPGLQVEGLLPV